MKLYRRYVWVLILTVLSQSIGIAAFNFFVDPYSTLKSWTWVKFNQIKPEKDKQVRLFKAIDVIRIKPTMVFIGSSRTEFGMDPSHPALATVQPAYNLGITGGNMYEARRYFEHASANQPNLKQVAIGLDLFMFGAIQDNKAGFTENRLLKTEITTEDLSNSLFSLDAFLGSINTIEANIKEPDAVGYFYPNGRRAVDYYIKYVYGGQQGKAIMKPLLKQNDFWIQKKSGKPYKILESYLKDVQIIVKTCQERKIDCKFFISPAHVTQWESIRVGEAWPVFERWKRELVKITPIWDFSGYNSITTEPLSNKMKNYIDSSHYRKEVGDLVINRIFDYREETVPEDFGVLISPENIESHLEQIRRDRESWAAKNPDVVKFVEDLKP